MIGHPERSEGSALMRKFDLTRGDSSHSFRMTKLVWEGERPREPPSLLIRYAFPRGTVGTSRRFRQRPPRSSVSSAVKHLSADYADNRRFIKMPVPNSLSINRNFLDTGVLTIATDYGYTLAVLFCSGSIISRGTLSTSFLGRCDRGYFFAVILLWMAV